MSKTTQLREQIDAFILKYEGIDAEQDTLNTIMYTIEQYVEEQKKDIELFARMDEHIEIGKIITRPELERLNLVTMLALHRRYDDLEEGKI